MASGGTTPDSGSLDNEVLAVLAATGGPPPCDWLAGVGEDDVGDGSGAAGGAPPSPGAREGDVPPAAPLKSLNPRATGRRAHIQAAMSGAVSRSSKRSN